jgi:hypothetical protein
MSRRVMATLVVRKVRHMSGRALLGGIGTFIAAALLAVSLVPVWAAPATSPLPRFTLVTLDGQPAASESLAIEQPWLLLYVVPDCEPCGSMLSRVSGMQLADRVSRLVIVVRGDAARVKAVRDRYPALHDARWYGDTGAAASRALRLSGVPALVACRASQEAWRFHGALDDEERFQSLVRSWVIQ